MIPLIAQVDQDVPASFIYSEYDVSDSAEEVKEKLLALRQAKKGWVAPSEEGWIEEIPLDESWIPEAFYEEFERWLFREDARKFDFFAICPWWRSPLDDGSGTHLQLTYTNLAFLTNDGNLFVLINDAIWPNVCFTDNRRDSGTTN